jgi:hypothetical protein
MCLLRAPASVLRMARILLPVVNLDVSCAWDVGGVRIHPAGSVAGIVAAARSGERGPVNATFEEWVEAKIRTLDSSAVAEVTVADQGEASSLVSSALSLLRIVQHVQNPMGDSTYQVFGLPGETSAAVVDYVIFDKGTMTTGNARVGALGGWELTDDDNAAWLTDPAYRFLDEALRVREAQRTMLQRRALIAAELLSQAWLSWKASVRLLNFVQAMEVLLGEKDDRAKKFRLARRVAYFACGWPGPRYTDGGRHACPYLSLPLTSGDLRQRLADVKRARSQGRPADCTQFHDVLDLYEARNRVVHEGWLPETGQDFRFETWMIAAVVLRPVLTWFADHPGADLAELDAEIAALPET